MPPAEPGSAADVSAAEAFSADVVIIGAGPAGLFAVFQLGLYDLRCVVVDSLGHAGGQLAEYYPDKPIYDVPGHTVVGALELVGALQKQIAPFGPVYRFGERVDHIAARAAGGFEVDTDGGTKLTCRAVVLATGGGAFRPKRPEIDGLAGFEAGGSVMAVFDPAALAGHDVVVLGGGDVALERAIAAAETGASVTLVHRRDDFQAAPALVVRFRTLVAEGRIRLAIGRPVGLEGAAGRLSGVLVRGLGVEQRVAATRLLPCLGTDFDRTGPAAWDLDASDGRIPVDPASFETRRPGIFAIGDGALYPGKLPLILCCFHEAALMAQAVRRRLQPETRPILPYSSSSSDLQRKLGVR